MSEELQDELIQFMFRRDQNDVLDVLQCLNLWFGKTNETDIEISLRFGAAVTKALRGGFNEWKATARGCLALMILVDQFPRNIYRHTANSFDGDSTARSIVDAGFNWLEVLEPEQCLFVPCLIMTHQECLEDQKDGLHFYDSLEPRLPSELRIFRTIFEEHLHIISLCGSFPHRDHYFGRPTSDIGRKLMENPKLRFDLPLIAKNGSVKFGHDPKKLWQAMQHAFDVLDRIDYLAINDVRSHGNIADDCRAKKDISECHEIFRAFDKDGSGSFDRKELAEVLESTGRKYDDIYLQSIIDSIAGISGSSYVTFEEFSAFLQVRIDTDPVARLRRRFEFFDYDGSGEISFEELKNCIQSLDNLVTGAEVKEILELHDENRNGSVSYEEFLKMLPMIIDQGAVENMPETSASADVTRKILENSAQVNVLEVSDSLLEPMIP